MNAGQSETLYFFARSARLVLPFYSGARSEADVILPGRLFTLSRALTLVLPISDRYKQNPLNRGTVSA